MNGKKYEKRALKQEIFENQEVEDWDTDCKIDVSEEKIKKSKKT